MTKEILPPNHQQYSYSTDNNKRYWFISRNHLFSAESSQALLHSHLKNKTKQKTINYKYVVSRKQVKNKSPDFRSSNVFMIPFYNLNSALPSLTRRNKNETPLVSHTRILTPLVDIYVNHRGGGPKKTQGNRPKQLDLVGHCPRCVKGDTLRSKYVHICVYSRGFIRSRSGRSGQRPGTYAHHGLVTLGEIHV